MKLLSWLFRKREPYNKEEILNDGLVLSLAFGKHWLQPIQSRLKKRYPALSEQELDFFNETCQKARETSHGEMHRFAEVNSKLMPLNEFGNFVKQQFPWATTKVIKSVYAQGQYYVYKDFGNLPKNT